MCLVSPKSCQNVPSFLIDTNNDEVSQDWYPDLLSSVPVPLNYGPWRPPIQANSLWDHGQNSVKQCQTVPDSVLPLQYASELHQKDLRINLVLLHIWDPENEAVLRADTFLALFLIVGIHVPGPS